MSCDGSWCSSPQEAGSNQDRRGCGRGVWVTRGGGGQRTTTVGVAPCCGIGLISSSLPGVAPFIQKPACGADDTKLAVLNQSNRNLLQPGAHDALVQIALGKQIGRASCRERV